MNRDDVRELLKKSGVTCESVGVIELKRLRRILSRNLRHSGIYNGTARLSPAKKDLKFIEMQTEQWKGREAISFNRDGFIGVAGWADNKNVQPILKSLVEWSINFHPVH